MTFEIKLHPDEDSDFPLLIPEEGGEPLPWTEENIQALVAKFSEKELQALVVKMLEWFIETDETSLGLSGNEYWTAGNYLAQALVKALKQKAANTTAPSN